MTPQPLGPGGTAVITGAASGFGLEASRIAARRGMQVVMADVQPDALEAAAAEIRGFGVPVLPFRLDVSKAAEVEALGAATQQAFGVPTFVFNNAGVGAGGLVWEHSARDWEWVIGVNLMGVAHGVRVFTPMMLAAAQAEAAQAAAQAAAASVTTPRSPGVGLAAALGSGPGVVAAAAREAAEAANHLLTNKKDEDGTGDVEAAVLSGGGVNFAPLSGLLRGAPSQLAPLATAGPVLAAALHIDKAAIALDRSAGARAGLVVYLIVLHAVLLLF